MSRKDENSQNPSPYAGRWVARLQGKIIGHGGTPEQARLAAQKSRYKERPEILYMPPTNPFPFYPLIKRVHEALPEQEIYLVGGMVRDAFLGRQSHDFDFALAKNGIGAARKVASALQADFYVLDEAFDTARVILSSNEGVRDVLDFSSYRGNDLESDLRSRDFTINALAFDIRNETILDPLNGSSDIRSKIIRACSETSFKGDPIRILRAVRQAAAFGFKIDPLTRKAMKQATGLLPAVSTERKRDELFKILDGYHPDTALRALEILGVFQYLLPELLELKGVVQSSPHIHDVWEHTLAVIHHLDMILTVLLPGYEADKTNDLFTGLFTLRLGRYREQINRHFSQPLNADRTLRALLFFAALYHDVAKPASKSVDPEGRIRFIEHEKPSAALAVERAKSFNLSNNEITRLEIIITNHMRFHFFTSQMDNEKKAPSRRAIYRFFRDVGEAGIDLILLGLADLRGTYGPNLTQETWTSGLDVARNLLENYWEKPEETITPPGLVDGHELIDEYKLKQGPVIGKLLEAIREAQAIGTLNTREEAIAFGWNWLKENNK
jgi:tRNA nucleotidyltransferase/poly(A) polymerase